MDFVLKLPQRIYKNNSDKIKGILIFIDEFQIIKELNDYEDSFLWKLRNYNSEFEDKIKIINTHLIVIWDKLTLREQNIIISLLGWSFKKK